ncbi:MAG: hypothetical protein JXB32_04265 [Deltaproteobacteria bacterium]|nr:hypothetical protein [Deltaproteobacteria bacterium]
MEGASDGHAFSVQFAVALSDEVLRRLAALYETSLAEGDARPAAAPWQWSGRFALFEVGERRAHGRSFLGPVTAFLRAAHALAPIRDVVYLNAREGGGAWDAWSLAQAPAPDPGPAGWACHGLFCRVVDAALPSPTPSDVFERARDAARSAAWGRAADAELEQAVTKTSGSRGLRLVRFEGDAPQAPVWPASDLALFRTPASVRLAGDHLVPWLWERPIARVETTDDGPAVNVAWLRGGARRTAALPDGLVAGDLGHLQGIVGLALHPSGERLLVCGPRRAAEILLDTGEVRELPPLPSSLRLLGVGYTADGWVALTANVVHLFVGPGRPRAAAVAGTRLRSVSAASALLIDDGCTTALYAVHGTTVSRAGAVPAMFGQARVHDGRLLVTAQPPGRWYELAGAMEALARPTGRRAPARPKAGAGLKAPAAKRTLTSRGAGARGASSRGSGRPARRRPRRRA